MDTLVVYYSLFGHNMSIAMDIAQENNYDVVEFNPGSILRVFQFFGRNKRLGKKAKQIDFSNYENLIVCGPIWAGKPAPAVIKLLEHIGIQNKNVSCNFTYTQDYGKTEAQITELISKYGGTPEEIVFWNIRENEEP
ncbi:MAG: flavodoxin family protein [Candidatus Thorarchaeota archaeon]